MDTTLPKITLETGLDLRQLTTTGSILHINEDYDDRENNMVPQKAESDVAAFIGEPISSFEELEITLHPIDEDGLVKKKILDEGGRLPVHTGCTVTILFCGYWENMEQPFDSTCLNKPLVVELKNSGLLPGLEMAILSMAVGETSVFLLSYKVMYGELGIPPRIKPKSDCVFYIKIIKSIITPKEGIINFSEPNMFPRVHHEVRSLFSSGCALYKAKNFILAIQLFNRGARMLHKCRLADEQEEKTQEKLLIKLYMNLAICNNMIKKPLKACIACNELNRLNSLWNNGKALVQNGKALRMIGEFKSAEYRLKRAMKLLPDRKDIEEELKILEKSREACNHMRLVIQNSSNKAKRGLNAEFKNEVHRLITQFKDNIDVIKLVLPSDLSSDEVEYIKHKCTQENLYLNKISNSVFSEDNGVCLEEKKKLVLEKEEDLIDDF